MQSPTTTNSSTSSASSQPIVGEPSSHGHSTQTARSSTRSRGSRTQTKWPEDKLTATRLDWLVTLAGALVQRIQWPKDRIIIPPMTRHPNPKAATGSRGTTSDGGAAAQCQQEKAQQ
jgi:hypothetical protein